MPIARILQRRPYQYKSALFERNQINCVENSSAAPQQKENLIDWQMIFKYVYHEEGH